MQFNTCWGTSLSALYLKRFVTFLFVVTAGPLALALGAAVLALYVALLFPVMIPACVSSSLSLSRFSRICPVLLMFAHDAYSYIWGRKHHSSWAYSFSEFVGHSLKKMIQVHSCSKPRAPAHRPTGFCRCSASYCLPPRPSSWPSPCSRSLFGSCGEFGLMMTSLNLRCVCIPLYWFDCPFL